MKRVVAGKVRGDITSFWYEFTSPGDISTLYREPEESPCIGHRVIFVMKSPSI